MKHACDQFSRLASERLERKLNVRERLSMQWHYLLCKGCAAYDKNISKLHQTLQLKITFDEAQMHLPEEKKQEIKQTIQSLLSKH